MAAMVSVRCRCCKQPFQARAADVRRGWGRFCSKSCKAVRQTQRTYISRGGGPMYEPGAQFTSSGEKLDCFTMSPAQLAGGGYGDSDHNDEPGQGKWEQW